VDVVGYLFLAGRLDDIAPLCTEMVKTFMQAGLPDRAMKALAYLNELAQQRVAQREHVAGVKQYLREFQSNPLADFDQDGSHGATPIQ
jgi:hypothetical protein